MDLDNPSYFNVAGDSRRNGGSDSTINSSECSLSRQLTPPRNKMNFRSFGRSISSNSNDSSHFIRGEPRLSDVAPELAAQHISRQNSKTKVQNGIVYTSVAVEPDSGDSADEVFLDETSAKYYNIQNGNRRHSIGSFAARERTTSLTSSVKSFRESPPTFARVDVVDSPVDVRGLVATSPVVEIIDDHAIRHGSFPRKRCNKCVKGTALKRANMEDIMIVSLQSSAPACKWVEYFTNYFEQMGKQTTRKAYKIHHLSAEDFMESRVDTNLFIEKSSYVKLQLVVMCPRLLEYITEHQDNTNFGKLFLPDRTLALLLGVCDNDLTEIHRKALPTYFKWQRKSVEQDQDENFTKEFIGHAMTMMAKIWKQQSSVAAQEKSCFSVSPKKIRQGQNSVLILLAYPLQKDDIIKISIVKDNEMYEVKSVKRRNPFTIKISVPDSFTEVTAIIHILVEKNGSIIGSRPIKCESRLRELEQILSGPVDFMCQSLGFNPADRENLDSWLVHNFQRNIPPQFNLLANHTTPFAATVQTHKHSYEECPTLLHFAAKFGLEKLALQLLECAGADVACEIRNINNWTPAEIADENNHVELAASLRNFTHMNEFSNMYAKFKDFSANYINQERSTEEDPAYLVPRKHEDHQAPLFSEEYHYPKSSNELYKVIRSAPRPVTLEIPPSPPPTTNSSCDFMSPNGYTHMHNPNTKPHELHVKDEIKISISPVNILTHSYKPKKHDHLEKESHSVTNQIPVHEDKFLEELVEIINDYKNNVHSITQVEELFEQWKKRNDGRDSVKERQRELREMRERYRKIQQEMKPGFFDKLKDIFIRPKSREHGQSEITLPTLTSSTSNLNISNPQTQRPVSSLSTSSSGSSGRMSTISGSSLGDSGTHSDNEERKNVIKVFTDDNRRNETDKFLTTQCTHNSSATKSNNVKCTNYNKTKLTPTIEETTSSHAKNEGLEGDINPHYITSLVSGRSVSDSFNACRKRIEEQLNCKPTGNPYMNIPANASFRNELASPPHDYMNLKTSNSIK